MKHIYLTLFAVLVTLPIFSLAAEKAEQKTKNKPMPISHTILAMAKGSGITRAKAIKAAELTCAALWGTDKLMKLQSCRLSKDGNWTVELFSDNGLDGWGCRITISQAGSLVRAEYLMGL